MKTDSFPRITIGVPSNGNIRTETMVSLVAAVANTKNVFFRIANPTGCYIHQNRENIVLEAQKQASTHLMFVDSDMAFESNAIKLLLDLDKDIIGANYNYRQLPKKSVVKLDFGQYDDGEVSITDDPNNKNQGLAIIKNPKKPFKCSAIGTGFLLIKMEVFEKLPRPWFFFEPSSSTRGMVGEDVWFCELARKHNFDIWCDPTIPVFHIGTTFY